MANKKPEEIDGATDAANAKLAAAEAKAEAKAEAEAKAVKAFKGKGHTHRVAAGKSITCKRGLLDSGAGLKAEDFGGGADDLKTLTTLGAVEKV